MDTEEKYFIGIMADELTTFGFLLAGIGERTPTSVNYFVVSSATRLKVVQDEFLKLYNRKNIGLILTTDEILHILQKRKVNLNKLLPIIVLIPTRTPIYQEHVLKLLEVKDKSKH